MLTVPIHDVRARIVPIHGRVCAHDTEKERTCFACAPLECPPCSSGVVHGLEHVMAAICRLIASKRRVRKKDSHGPDGGYQGIYVVVPFYELIGRAALACVNFVTTLVIAQ